MSVQTRRPKIFMMDLWAIVPYYTAYLSKALRREDLDLTVGSISYYLDPDCFTSRGIKVDPGLMDVVGRFKLPRAPRRILKFAEAMLNLCALSLRFCLSAPDIIHIQYLPMLQWRLPLDFWFLTFCRWRGARLILTVHDLLPHDTAETHKRTFLSLYGSVDQIICHSDHIKTQLGLDFRIPEVKISVIPHGPFFYDLPAEDPEPTLRALRVPSGKILVLWQGIILPYKGIDLLLDAWAKLESETNDAYLVIAGLGAPALQDEIRQQAARLDLKNVTLHFSFITTQELVAIYRAADVVVYPYRAITTSGALATGMAIGKTILASDLAVFREMLEDRVNALLVDPQNAEQLAGALLELTQNSSLRQSLANRVKALNFGDGQWNSIADQTLKAYDEQLCQRR